MRFKEVKKILINNGWVLVRVAGSHYQFKKKNVNFVATIPCHGSDDISLFVLKCLEKGTGLSIINR